VAIQGSVLVYTPLWDCSVHFNNKEVSNFIV